MGEVETCHRQADVTEGAEIVGALGRSLDDAGVVATVDHTAGGRVPNRRVTIDVSFDEARRLIDVLEDRTRE